MLSPLSEAEEPSTDDSRTAGRGGCSDTKPHLHPPFTLAPDATPRLWRESINKTTAASYALTTATQTTDNTPTYECTIDGATAATLNIGLQILYVPANSGPTSVPTPAAILAENGGEAQGDGASLLWTNTTAAAATFTRAGGVNISGVAAIGILGTA